MKVLFIIMVIVYLSLCVISAVKKRKAKKEFTYDYTKSKQSKVQKH